MPAWLISLLPYLPGIIDDVIQLVENLIEHKTSLGHDVTDDQATLEWLEEYKNASTVERVEMVQSIEG